MNHIYISILMTAYNSEKTIGSSITSVLMQTYKFFELIIIDDGSIDNTNEKVKEFYDNRIRHFKINHSGMAKALNFGLSKARFDWVAIIDSDDLWNENKLNEQIKFLNPTSLLIACYSVYFKGKSIKFFEQNHESKNLGLEELFLHPKICHSSVIIRKAILLENNGYDETKLTGIDYDLYLRLKEKVNIKVVPKHLVYYRISDKSLSRKNREFSRNNIYLLTKPYYQNFEKEFGINDKKLKLIIRGWREYFYGDRKMARKYWSKSKAVSNLRIFIALALTFLPENIFNTVRDLSIRPRLKYFLFYFHPETIKIRRKFLSTLQTCSSE